VLCVSRLKRGRGQATIGFHSLGGINGIAPDVVCNFVGAEHTSNNRPSGVDPDAQLQFLGSAFRAIGRSPTRNAIVTENLTLARDYLVLTSWQAKLRLGLLVSSTKVNSS
jgi:hypothetical protein